MRIDAKDNPFVSSFTSFVHRLDKAKQSFLVPQYKRLHAVAMLLFSISH